MRMAEASVITRQVPTQEQTFKLEGQTYFAAPALAMIRPKYRLAGIIRFTPQPNAKYRITGELGKAYSAVWIEDIASGSVVSNKIESTNSEVPLMTKMLE